VENPKALSRIARKDSCFFGEAALAMIFLHEKSPATYMLEGEFVAGKHTASACNQIDP
jgi:hypothetical protein